MKELKDDKTMNVYMNLIYEGFTHSQAMAVLNAIDAIANAGKPQIDMVDLLPFHSWLWYRLKQRREAKRRKK